MGYNFPGMSHAAQSDQDLGHFKGQVESYSSGSFCVGPARSYLLLGEISHWF